MNLLKIADTVFFIAAVLAILIGHLRIGLVLGIMSAAGFYLLRSASKKRRAEQMLEIAPGDWTVEQKGGGAADAWLEIPEERHGRGSDINVRIEQLERKRWDLEEPTIQNGKVTIRYSPNNLPWNPEFACASISLGAVDGGMERDGVASNI